MVNFNTYANFRNISRHPYKHCDPQVENPWFRVYSNFIVQFIVKYEVFCVSGFFASFPVHLGGGGNPDFDCTYNNTDFGISDYVL